MLLMITWMLFWKLYGLAVVCLIAIPITDGLRNSVERYPAVQQSSEKLQEKDRDHLSLPSELRDNANYIVPLQLKIWEPETPPVIIKAVVNAQVRSTCNKGKGNRKVRKTGRSKKRSVQVKSNVHQKSNQQNKVFRRGLRRIAGELAACLNGVAENTTTETELYKAMRLVIRQHPRLRSLPYREALQALLWMENDFAAVTIMPMKGNEGW
jgi:hypothetical protein